MATAPQNAPPAEGTLFPIPVDRLLMLGLVLVFGGVVALSFNARLTPKTAEAAPAEAAPTAAEAAAAAAADDAAAAVDAAAEPAQPVAEPAPKVDPTPPRPAPIREQKKRPTQRPSPAPTPDKNPDAQQVAPAPYEQRTLPTDDKRPPTAN